MDFISKYRDLKMSHTQKKLLKELKVVTSREEDNFLKRALSII